MTPGGLGDMDSGDREYLHQEYVVRPTQEAMDAMTPPDGLDGGGGASPIPKPIVLIGGAIGFGYGLYWNAGWWTVLHVLIAIWLLDFLYLTITLNWRPLLILGAIGSAGYLAHDAFAPDYAGSFFPKAQVLPSAPSAALDAAIDHVAGLGANLAAATTKTDALWYAPTQPSPTAGRQAISFDTVILQVARCYENSVPTSAPPKRATASLQSDATFARAGFPPTLRRAVLGMRAGEARFIVCATDPDDPATVTAYKLELLAFSN